MTDLEILDRINGAVDAGLLVVRAEQVEQRKRIEELERWYSRVTGMWLVLALLIPIACGIVMYTAVDVIREMRRPAAAAHTR